VNFIARKFKIETLSLSNPDADSSFWATEDFAKDKEQLGQMCMAAVNPTPHT